MDSWALPLVLAGTFMTILDFFIVNVALPDIQHHLYASGATIQLIVAGYGLTLATGLTTGGRPTEYAAAREGACELKHTDRATPLLTKTEYM